jgi:hypothetical protein
MSPSRYTNAKEQQEEEEEEEEDETTNGSMQVHDQLIRQKLAWLHEKQTSSLESVMNDHGGDSTKTTFTTNPHEGILPMTPFSSPTQQTSPFMANHHSSSINNNTPQYHLKSGRKMLPLEKIRPTSK